MSIQKMRRRFAVQLRIVLWVLTAVFIIGLPLVFAPSGMFNRDQRPPEEQQGSSAAATVNGKPVTRAEVETALEAMLSQLGPLYAQMGQPLSLDQLPQMRRDALEQAIQSRLVVDQAEKQGISVSKGDVKKRAEQETDQQLAQIKTQVPSDQLGEVLAKIVAQNEQAELASSTLSEKQFRKWAVDFYTDPTKGLRDQMISDQLRQTVVGKQPATEQDLLESYDRATVRRITVSRYPIGKPERTEEEAKKRAGELLDKINQGANFEALAKAESDAPDAKDTGGLLENVGRDRMPKEWDRAVFALKPGEVSPVIPGTSGFEIVQMVKKDRQLPPDFEKNKEQLLKSLSQRKEGSAWSEYVRGLRKKADVKVTDPEMRAYDALEAGKQDEAIKLLQEAAQEARAERNLGTAAVFYELATLQASKNDWKSAADSYAEAGDALISDKGEILPGARAQTLLGQARASEQLGNTEEALMWYQAASDATDIPSIHQQLQATYLRLGRQDLADHEQQWMADYQKAMAERQKQYEEQMKAMEQQSTQPKAGQPAGPKATPPVGTKAPAQPAETTPK